MKTTQMDTTAPTPPKDPRIFALLDNGKHVLFFAKEEDAMGALDFYGKKKTAEGEGTNQLDIHRVHVYHSLSEYDEDLCAQVAENALKRLSSYEWNMLSRYIRFNGGRL